MLSCTDSVYAVKLHWLDIFLLYTVNDRDIVFFFFWYVANHSNFVDFTSRALFYIMTSLPTFIKVGGNPAILEKQAVNVFILAFLWTVDFIQLVTFCDFKKMRIQKLLNRVEKYRWIFLWTTRHKGKWFFFKILH